MELKYARDFGQSTTAPTQSAISPTQVPQQLPEEFTVDDLAGDEGRLMNVRSYMMDRLGQKVNRKKTKTTRITLSVFLPTCVPLRTAP